MAPWALGQAAFLRRGFRGPCQEQPPEPHRRRDVAAGRRRPGALCLPALLQEWCCPPGRPQTGSGAGGESGHGTKDRDTWGPLPPPSRAAGQTPQWAARQCNLIPLSFNPMAGNFTVREGMQRRLWGPCTGRTQPAASRASLQRARRPLPPGVQLTQGAAPPPHPQAWLHTPHGSSRGWRHETSACLTL